MRRALALVAVLAVICGFSLGAVVGAPSPATDATVKHLVVQPGDSWNAIAKRLAPSLTGSALTLYAQSLAIANGGSFSTVLVPGRILVYDPTVIPGAPASTSSSTSSTSTTMAMPMPTTTGPASTTTAPPPAVPGAQFSESFTGDTGLDRFDYSVDFRNVDLGVPADQLTQPWMADHDMSMPCGDPTTHRVVHPDKLDEIFFTCRDHMMTSLGDGLDGARHNDDYSVASFTPKQTFPTVNKVCVDFNLTDMLNREWVTIDIVVPSASNFEIPSWLIPNPVPATGTKVRTYEQSGGVHAHWNLLGSHKIGLGSDQMDWQELRGVTDIKSRYTTCVTNNHDGTATITQVRPTGNPDTPTTLVTFTGKAAWPTGPAKVVFSQHAYNPSKDGTPPTFTIHWDNVSIS